MENLDFEKGMAVFEANLGPAGRAYLDACVRCGLCADSCHYHRADPCLENVPARKLDLLARAYQRKHGALGRLGLGGPALDKARVEAWVDAVFGRCSLCGRCSVNCTVGIALPKVFRAARAALGAMGLTPEEIQGAVENALGKGNSMAIGREDWLETVAWIEEELQQEVGDPAARLPMDKAGAEYLFTVNPREPKFFPLSLQASAKVFWAAGADWTLASEGWDLTNYGLFSCRDDQAGAITQQLVDAMARLGCRTLVIGECGHGFGSIRWEGPEWLQRAYPFKVVSILELMDQWLAEGRIQVDPALNPKPLTLHDPCNLVRHGGMAEPQRRVLRACSADFREMTPRGIENFCCGGGGGQLAIGRNKTRRLQAGSPKAEQIRATGAKVVASPCHNCTDQLSELNKEYRLNVQIKSVAELVADALVCPAREGDA